jgi:hypothetical protein
MSSTRRLLAMGCGLLAASLSNAMAKPSYEVWAIDQSNVSG